MFYINFMHSFGKQMLTDLCDFFGIQISMNSRIVSMVLGGNL